MQDNTEALINVGCVIYRPGDQPGTLEARWCHPYFGKGMTGTGKATDGPLEGYVGRYEIQYYNAEGEGVGSYELNIERDGECYLLSWIKDGEVQDRGAGFEIPEGLIAGWFHCDDRKVEDFETV